MRYIKPIVRISATTLKIAGTFIVVFIVGLLFIGISFFSMWGAIVLWQEGHYATAAFLTALAIASIFVLAFIAKKSGVDFIDFG